MDELLAELFPDSLPALPSAGPDLSILLAKEKEENARLKFMIASLHKSTQSISEIYKREQKTSQELSKQIEATKAQHSELKLKYEELENRNVNKLYYQDQLLAEFQEKPIEANKDYEELSKEYLSLLSYLTTNNNFEIDTKRNRIILKTEKFVRQFSPDFKAKIIKSNGRKNKRAGKAPKSQTKRRKCGENNEESWEEVSTTTTMSETSSMYSYDGEDNFDDNSNFDFVEPKSPWTDLKQQVKEIREEPAAEIKEFKEISTQTDCDRPIILSVTSEKCTNTEPDLELHRQEVELISVATNTEHLDLKTPQIEVETFNASTNTEETSTKPASCSISTNTEPFNPQDSQKTVETANKSTSYYSEMQSVSTSCADLVLNCDKSTATIFSTVTRGTSSQDLEDELTVQSIFSETIFTVPSFIEPFISEIITSKNAGTMTDLSNINKKISYIQVTEELIKLKKECISPAPSVHNFNHNSSLAPNLWSFEQLYDNKKFITIGKIMFELFLDMIKPNVDVQNNYLESCSQLKDKFMESFLEICQSDKNACELFAGVPREENSVLNSYIKNLPLHLNMEQENCDGHKEVDPPVIEPICEAISETISEALIEPTPPEIILPEMLQFAELIRSPPLPKFLSPIKEVSFQVPATPSPQKKRQVVVKPLVLSSQKAEKKAVSQMRPMKPVNSTSTPSHQMHFQKVKKPKKKSQGKIIRGIRKYFGMPPSLITPINELLDFTKVTIDQRLKPRSMNETQNLFEPIMLKMIPETVSSSQVKETEETKELDQPTATELDNIEYFEELQRELVSIIQEEIIPKQAQLNETLEGDHSTASQLENIEYIEELQRELVPKIQEEITQALFNENSKEDQSTETELENLEYIEDVDTNIEEIEETVPEDIDELLLSEILNQLEFESPQSPTEFLHEVDFTHEPITIPLSSEDDEVAEIFSVPPKKLELGNIESSPQSPFPEHPSLKYEQPKEIPSEDLSNFAGASNEKINDLVLNFDPKIRATILKSHKQILVKNEDKKLCKLRKSIKVFLDEEWTSETTQTCFDCLSKNPKEHLLSLALLETVDDHGLDEISYEFTPPAPPLPKYQQKLILLVKKLKPLIPGLARKLLDGLEQRLFSFDAGQLDLDTLSNYSYLYAALVDLFLSGDHSILFHFIYKSIYFHGYKALQMAFVVLKSCPLTLPKKSYFLEGGDTILKFEEIDPLVLTVMQILSNTESYHDKKHESYAMKDHEMFRYFPRHYGFPLNFLKSEQILKLLVGHIQANRCQNVAFSLIILAKRSYFDFAHKNILKTNLIPLLKGFFAKSLVKGDEDKHTDQINLLIESITTIMKQMKNDQEKVSQDVFTLLGEILHRTSKKSVQESCIQGILRINRFSGNLKDIYQMIQQWNPAYQISEHTQLMVQTFVHRKERTFFKV